MPVTQETEIRLKVRELSNSMICTRTKGTQKGVTVNVKCLKRLIPNRMKQQKAPTKPHSAFADLKIGQRDVIFGMLKWRVLDIKDGKALLLSEEILWKEWYHSPFTRITWEQCELRRYLNDDFFHSFCPEEQKQIAEVYNDNLDNQWTKSVGGNVTKDKIFLLSIEEVVRFFGDSGLLKQRPRLECFINDEYSEARIAYFQGSKFWWWLRSPGAFGFSAATVNDRGAISTYGEYVYISFPYMSETISITDDRGGVRPALWLNL